MRGGTMPFDSRCPSCGLPGRVPESRLGTIGQCKRCGNYYTLAPVEEALPESAAEESRSPEATAAEEVAAPGFAERLDALAAAAWEGPAARRVQPLGVVALLLASGAILSASFPWSCWLVLPLSAAGLLAGVAGCRLAEATAKWRAVSVLASVTAGMLLILASLWPAALGPIYEASRSSARFDPAARVVPLPGKSGAATSGSWVDASQAGIREDGTLVLIDRVWIGPLDDGAKKSKSASKEQFLFVRIHILGRRSDDKADGVGSARLTDTRGNEYEPRDLPAKKATAEATKHVRELLLAFAPPGDKTALRLEIPAASWGGKERLRWLIPGEMIEGDGV